MKSRRRSWLVTAAGLPLLVLGAVFARAEGEGGARPEQGDKPPKEGSLVARFDANGDGALTQDEVSEKIWAKVAGADADGNGQVTEAELKAHAPKREDRPAPEAMFRKFDADGNGALTEAEVPAEVWGKVKGADADANGQVSLDEFKAAAPPPKPEGDRPSPEAMFKRFDANGDGAVTEVEVPVRSGPRSAARMPTVTVRSAPRSSPPPTARSRKATGRVPRRCSRSSTLMATAS